MVIPVDLMDRFVAVRHAMDIFPPYLHQEVMADFSLEGHFTRHIRKMRQVYRERRSVLYEALTEQFPPHRGFEVLGVEAGMHLAFTLPEGFNDREISARAANSRLWLWPLSTSYISDASKQRMAQHLRANCRTWLRRSTRQICPERFPSRPAQWSLRWPRRTRQQPELGRRPERVRSRTFWLGLRSSINWNGKRIDRRASAHNY